MTAIQPFDFSGQQVRVVADEHGAPWFVAADVCAVLDIANGRDALTRLAADEKGVGTTDTLGGTQQVATVNEAGLYRLIFTSRKAEAETFRRWVTHEVLPAIRRTGSYGVAVPDLSTPEGVLAMAEQFTATARALVASRQEVAALAPRAEVADRLLTADGDLSVADTAKALTRAGVKVGAGRLFGLLATMHWIYRAQGDGRWRVYQAAIDGGWMTVLPSSHYHPKTGVLVLDPPQPRVTPKGLQRLLRDHGADVAAAPAQLVGAR